MTGKFRNVTGQWIYKEGQNIYMKHMVDISTNLGTNSIFTL